MPKPKLSPKHKRLRDFFIGLTAKVIHDYQYKSNNAAATKAIEIVDKDWPFLIRMLDKVFDDWNATPNGLFLITKPLTHRFLYDKQYAYRGKLKEDTLLKAGKATIILSTGATANITFSNKNFQHGHIYENGSIGCRGFYYGDKNGFEENLIKHGPSNLLATTLTFCLTSRYGTKGDIIHARKHDKVG